MAYSDFTFPEVVDTFGLDYRGPTELFAAAREVTPTRTLLESLARGSALAGQLNTEKIWSELVIAPILLEVWNAAKSKQVTYYSGTEFFVDAADKLTGFCDFILGSGPQYAHVTAPLVMIVEAKREDINAGLGQCGAAMVAAQRFNARAGKESTAIHGCVTTGPLWRFLRLEGKLMQQDEQLRLISELPKLLGIFLHILGVMPTGA